MNTGVFNIGAELMLFFGIDAELVLVFAVDAELVPVFGVDEELRGAPPSRPTLGIHEGQANFCVSYFYCVFWLTNFSPAIRVFQQRFRR